ncbi:MAG: hypothetical protein ACJAWV_004295 [Flammeovirgaceae bacterium]|jgi:hypothetical protein
MSELQFPLNLQFKIATLANDFIAKDANERTIAYVRQKMFKLKADINVYTDETKASEMFSIKADKWLDFSTSYAFSDNEGNLLGRVSRKGWKSIWKARYEIYDEQGKQDLLIQEENAWVKVGDQLLGEIPILGMLTGYLFNPTYVLTRPDGTLVAKLKKNPSFFGRNFTVSKEAEFQTGEETRILLGLMMMVLLERRRG